MGPRHRARFVLSTLAMVVALAVTAGSVAAAQPVKAKVKKDVLTVSGTKAGEIIVIRLDTDPTVLAIDVGGDGTTDLKAARSTFSQIVVEGEGGNDTLRIDNLFGSFTDEHVTLDGGSGADVLGGGDGADLLLGGPDDDVLDGNRGIDAMNGGGGDDTLAWDPGDGSDVLEGEGGTDTMLFNGSAAGELFEVSPNAGHVIFTRNVGTIAMDLDDVETIDLRARGGIDTLTVNDTAGTDLDLILADLSALGDGGAGDGSDDDVIVNGTGGNDTFSVAAVGGGVDVTRAGTAGTRIVGSEAANDTLTVNGLVGNDAINVGAGVAALIQVVQNP